NMRKTFLAIGFAVLVSMMLAPHGGKQGIQGWGPFFSAKGFGVTSSGIWYGNAGRVMIDMLALEIVFLSVLFAVIANIRWRRRGVYLVVTCLGVAAIAGGIIGLVRLREAAVEGAVPRARSDERYADRLLRSASSSTAWIPPEVRQENLENAKLYLRHAAE